MRSAFISFRPRGLARTVLLSSLLRIAETSFIIARPMSRCWHIPICRLFASYEGKSPQVCSQRPLPTDAVELQMLSFYRFVPIEDPIRIRDDLFSALKHIPGLRGTIYLASEGVNAQLAVPCGESLETLLNVCSQQLPFDPFDMNHPPNLGDVVPVSTPTFNRLIVRTRDEVLRDGLDDTLDWNNAGLELSPSVWDQELRQSESLVLLDCRNTYESDEGSFQGSTPLKTQTFQESWAQLEEETKTLDRVHPIHIFCTGGIRCVKVGSYLKQKLGFSDVRRLQHGIIGYHRWEAENNVDRSESIWKGENFLFDKRRFDQKKNDEA